MINSAEDAALADEKVISASMFNIDNPASLDNQILEKLQRLQLKQRQIELQEQQQSLSSSPKTKIQILQQTYESITQELECLKVEAARDRKMRSLEWAIDNADKYGRFKYRHTKVNPKTVYDSTEYVQHVLLFFRKGGGTPIDSNIYISDRREEYATEAEKKMFRDMLTKQILELTGQKPRIVQKDERYVIYYSWWKKEEDEWIFSFIVCFLYLNPDTTIIRCLYVWFAPYQHEHAALANGCLFEQPRVYILTCNRY